MVPILSSIIPRKKFYCCEFRVYGFALNEAVLEMLKIHFNGSHDTLWMPNSLLSYFIQQFIATSHFRLEILLTNTFARRGIWILDSYLGSLRVLSKSQHLCDLESVEPTWHFAKWLFRSLFVDSGFWKFLIWFGFNKTRVPAGLAIKIRWTSVEKLSFGYFGRSHVLSHDVTVYLQSKVGVTVDDWPPQPTRW